MSRNISHIEPPSTGASPSEPETAADLIGYAIAAVILIIGGAILRTPILNWICGPAIVILCVVLAGVRRDRKPVGAGK